MSGFLSCDVTDCEKFKAGPHRFCESHLLLNDPSAYEDYIKGKREEYRLKCVNCGVDNKGLFFDEVPETVECKVCKTEHPGSAAKIRTK